MIYLILMTCQALECEHLEVLGEYRSMVECEQAMKETDTVAGQALMCWGEKPEVIKT